MKILHVITSLRTGGAEHLLVDLLPRLRDYGHEVSLLLFDGTCTPFYEQLEKEGISIYSLGKGVQAMHNPMITLKLKKYLDKYDIVHTHNTPCQLLVAIAKPADKTLLVTTEHNTTNRRRLWRWYRKIDCWMYGKYQRIICVSKEAESNLIQSFQDSSLIEKVRTIYNGIDINKYIDTKQDSELLERYAKCKLVVMVAAFRPQKDHPTLIKAMKELPESYHLLLAGDGPCRKECEELSEKLNLKERVHFLGICSNIPSLLNTADIIVLSSHYEGLSLSSIEGMASGKPFIASDVDGLREIVEGAGLLYPHRDSNELARLIKEVCGDKLLYQQIAERCKQKAMQYDISHTVKEYARVYEEIGRE